MQITCKKMMDKPTRALAETLNDKHVWDVKFYERIKKRWESQTSSLVQTISFPSSEERILTLLPEFLKTKEPAFCSPAEFDEYNRQHDKDAAVEVAQNHAAEQRKKVA